MKLSDKIIITRYKVYIVCELHQKFHCDSARLDWCSRAHPFDERRKLI